MVSRDLQISVSRLCMAARVMSQGRQTSQLPWRLGPEP